MIFWSLVGALIGLSLKVGPSAVLVSGICRVHLTQKISVAAVQRIGIGVHVKLLKRYRVHDLGQISLLESSSRPGSGAV